MLTRMKITNKKGLTLTGNLAESQVGTAKLEGQTLLETAKGPTLLDFSGSVLKESWISKRTDPNGPLSPSPKLSPGLSNQPKAPIYSFWQSQSQIANLPSIL